MWDRQRRGSRRCELHSHKACGQSDGHLCNGPPFMAGNIIRASTPETLSASNIVDAKAVCFLEHTSKSSALSHQMALHKGAGNLALGRLRSRFERTLRAGFKEELDASSAEGFLAYETEMVYRGDCSHQRHQ